MGGAHPREARSEPLGRAFAPADRPPGALGQAERELLDRDRFVFCIAADAPRRPPAPRPWLRRQRLRARRPHRCVRQNAGGIAQSQRRDRRAQARVVAVARIEQHDAARKAGRAGPAQLIERDLGLGAKGDLCGNARLAPACRVRGPLLRQIQPPAHRQARMAVGKRQRNGGLAVVLLAELAAILPRPPTECRPFFGNLVSSMIQASIGRGAPSPAAPSRAPWPAPARPTTAPDRQNAAAIGAAPPSARAPSAPPSARRSCARTAAAAQRSNPAAAPPDRHARSRSQALQHIVQSASRSPPSPEDPSRLPRQK